MSTERHTEGRVVVVGAAAAGYATAECLRQRGYTGEIVLIGDEAGDPCDRPPLSKQVLAGSWEPSRAALMPAARMSRIEVTTRPATATKLDVEEHRIELSDGASLDYDEIVIATGVRPRTLPDSPVDAHVLRTMTDTLRLRESLGPDRKLVVIGA